ncbi:MAG TPA: hypothetical protein VIK93_00750 [Limnochordales bacterium]
MSAERLDAGWRWRLWLRTAAVALLVLSVLFHVYRWMWPESRDPNRPPPAAPLVAAAAGAHRRGAEVP